MVIYLKIVRNFEKFFVGFIGLLFVIYVGYLIDFVKYNNYDSVMLNTLKIENDNLRKKVIDLETGLNLKSNGDFIISRVLIRDIYKFYDEIIIDSNNVSLGDAVINEEGLIGIVSDIRNDKSIVALLTSDVNVSVSINGVYGVLQNGVVSMLDKYSKINVGDKVYTSGLTLVPGGIYVGEVVSVDETGDGLGLVAKVKIISNNDLNYVGIARSNSNDN